MEEKNKLTGDQKTEDNEIVELKDDDMSTITAGSITQKESKSTFKIEKNKKKITLTYP